MSFEPSFTVTHAITADLTRIERARGFLEAATLSEDWIRQMGERALVLEAHHTTHIEGTTLTLEESKRLFTISEYYDRDRSAFYRAIQGVREQDMDLTGWLEFFTAGLATQLDEVKARGERTIRRDILMQQHALSDRQAIALGHVIDHGRLAIQDFERLCPGTNRRTLQRDLKALVEKGLFAKAGTAPTDPTRHYRLAEGVTRSEAEL